MIPPQGAGITGLVGRDCLAAVGRPVLGGVCACGVGFGDVVWVLGLCVFVLGLECLLDLSDLLDLLDLCVSCRFP